MIMPGLQSSLSSPSVTSSNGGASGAVRSGNEDSRVRDMILYSFHDIFSNYCFFARFKVFMPGVESSSGFPLQTSSDGGAFGAVGSGNEDSRVRDMILHSFHDIFSNSCFLPGSRYLCPVLKVHQVPHQ